MAAPPLYVEQSRGIDMADQVEDDDDNVSVMLNVALGKWFLLLLDHGPDHPRVVRARAHALALGAPEEAFEWASTRGVEMISRMDD